MRILAIETSTDETAAAVLISSGDTKSPHIAANIIASKSLSTPKTGGVVPEVAARAHIEKLFRHPHGAC